MSVVLTFPVENQLGDVVVVVVVRALHTASADRRLKASASGGREGRREGAKDLAIVVAGNEEEKNERRFFCFALAERVEKVKFLLQAHVCSGRRKSQEDAEKCLPQNALSIITRC